MTEKKLIDKLKQLKSALEKQKRGRFYLFALNFDSSTRSWDLLVSAEWLESDKTTGIRLVGSAIEKVLTMAERRLISRVAVISKNSELLLRLASGINVEGPSDVSIESCLVNGVFFKKMIIFAARLPSAPMDQVTSALEKKIANRQMIASNAKPTRPKPKRSKGKVTPKKRRTPKVVRK